MLRFIQYSSQDIEFYKQSIALRNRDLYGVIGMSDLSDEGMAIEKDNFFFGVCDDGRLVGTVSFYEVASQHFQLVAMTISRNYQGQGIGGRLVTFALETLKKNYQAYQVTTNARQTAQVFYERLGFKQIGDPRVSQSHNGSVSVPMRKLILEK